MKNDPYTFYKEYFKGLVPGKEEQLVACPFHEDNKPSLSVNIVSGSFCCHAAGCGVGGGPVEFYAKYHSTDKKSAGKILGYKKSVPIEAIRKMNEHLLADEAVLLKLSEDRGWDLEIVHDRLLGLETQRGTKRVVFPVFDKNGSCINVRRWDLYHKTTRKFLNGGSGYDSNALYPIATMGEDIVFLLAGEPDTVLACSLGIPAVTVTGGEGTMPKKLVPLFKDKVVSICYDVNDANDAGGKGADRVAKVLSKIAKKVLIVTLPADKIASDFTDFHLYCARNKLDTVDEFYKVAAEAQIFSAVEKEEEYEEPELVDFDEAVGEDNYGKPIKMRAVCIGKVLEPFFFPKKISFSCTLTPSDDKNCLACSLGFKGGEHSVDVTHRCIELINLPSDVQRKKILYLSGVHSRCKCLKMKVEERGTVEEIHISCEIGDVMGREHAIRRSFCIGHDIHTNRPYEFIGKTIADPRSQIATHVFTDKKQLSTSIESFELKDPERLDIFKGDPRYKIDEIYYDLTYNVPEVIIGRRNVMLAADLVFHSVRGFDFCGSRISKGWAECLIIGDQRTGKSQTCGKLLRHYNAGDYITLEKSSLAGLVGGQQFVQGSPVLIWGLLPRNDGGLVMLDELKETKQSSLADIAALRETGIAERTLVGGTRKTNSRVRMLMIANPPTHTGKLKTMSSYAYGVEAVSDLIDRPADIARFDMVIGVSKETVSVEDICAIKNMNVPHVYTSDLCHERVMWAWSRRPENVKFTENATKRILHETQRFAREYSEEIPIVQGSVQRLKLARLSAGLAAMMFSTDNYIDLDVREIHVDYVARFLRDIYNEPTFGYGEYSSIRVEKKQVAAKEAVESRIINLRDKARFVRLMLTTDDIYIDDILDFSESHNLTDARTWKTDLVNEGLLKRVGMFYKKTRKFVSVLKQMDKEE